MVRIYLTLFFVSVFCLLGFAQSDYKRIEVSEDIQLIKLSDKAYVHVSAADIGGFGKVSSNGLIVVDNGEAFLFDTPVTNAQTEVLAKWITDSLHAKITTFVPNHWHEDCMGGLDYLNSQGVKSYASQKTIGITKEKELPQPKYAFNDSILLNLQGIDIYCYYLGGGHTIDNIVTWIPSEKILFGGCMVKELSSKGLGNVTDADIEEWPKTIDKVLTQFSDAMIVIPGHGQIGGLGLVEHTQELLIGK